MRCSKPCQSPNPNLYPSLDHKPDAASFASAHSQANACASLKRVLSPELTPTCPARLTAASCALRAQELLCSMRALLQAGAEQEGSPVHQQLIWLVGQYVQVRWHVSTAAEHSQLPLKTTHLVVLR